MKDNIPLYVIAFLFTLSFTVLSARLIIPILKSKAKQPIYSDGPSWHLSKSGTPTMGGLAFVFGITVTLLLCSLYKYIMKENESALSLLICTVYALLNSSVGIIDDITKLKRKENLQLLLMMVMKKKNKKMIKRLRYQVLMNLKTCKLKIVMHLRRRMTLVLLR